jgi:hypothetical protein
VVRALWKSKNLCCPSLTPTHLSQINPLDSKAIRESIRHRNSSLPPSLSQTFSFAEIYKPTVESGESPSRLHVSTKAVDESDEVDTSDYCSSASNRAWNSPFVISSPHLLDEGMMEREDVRAEQQAESVIRSGVESLTVAQSRKGTLLSQPSFFSDQEMSDDSDDEAVSPKLNKNMDRKTMQQIIRQHSGQELKIADGAVEDKPCTPVARNNPDTIGGDIIGGEPDCDEEFVFQYGTQYLPSPTDRPQRS